MGILVARGELPPRWKTMARRMRASVDQRGKQPGPVEGRIDTNQSWEIKIVRNSLRDKLSLSLRSRFPHRFSFPSSNEDFAPLLWPDDLDVAYREKREEKKGKEKEKGKKRADHERRDDESLERWEKNRWLENSSSGEIIVRLSNVKNGGENVTHSSEITLFGKVGEICREREEERRPYG